MKLCKLRCTIKFCALKSDLDNSLPLGLLYLSDVYASHAQASLRSDGEKQKKAILQYKVFIISCRLAGTSITHISPTFSFYFS